MHASSTDRNRDVGAGMDQQPGGRARVAEDGEHLPRKMGQVARGEVRFAKEKEVDAIPGKAVGLFKEFKKIGLRRQGASRIGNRFLPGKQVTVGDAVAQHGLSVSTVPGCGRALG